jgi:cytochrome b561
MTDKVSERSAPVEVYSPIARTLHWLTVGFVAVLIPVGLAMTYRGNTLNIWDDTTNNLYSLHKLAGFTLLWIIVLRIVYRLWHGAPKPEPTLEPWQRFGSRIVHFALYAVVLAMPILGWIGVSYYPALDIFGWFSLPALVAPDEAAANRVLAIHATLAFVLLGLIAAHAGMALYHHFGRGDNVLRRMLTGRPR